MEAKTGQLFLDTKVIVNTIRRVNILFDPAKDATNRAKHGVSLALAAQMEWPSAVIWPDLRQRYDESRQCALALMGERVFFVAFVDRADGRRIISLRKANDREKRHYAKVSDD